MNDEGTTETVRILRFGVAVIPICSWLVDLQCAISIQVNLGAMGDKP
jgi:hypothetical protein